MKRAFFHLLAFLALAIGTPALAQGMSGPGCGNGVQCSSLAVSPRTLSYTVGAGGDFASLTAAYVFLNQQVAPSGSVTLTLLDGVETEPGSLYIATPSSKFTTIQGQHAYSFTQSSVVSSSGSAGAWTYTLQLNTATNLAVGDYLTVPAPSGGTNPTYLAGVWPITAVNSGASQVTITTTGKQAAAASGAVTGTVTDFKSTVKFVGVDGFHVWDGGSAVNANNFNLVGDGTAGTVGLSIQDVGRINISSLSVSGFGGYNVLALLNSEINAGGFLVSSASGGVGIQVANGSTVDVPTIVSSGNVGNGIVSISNSSVVYETASIVSGNGGNGVLTDGAGMFGNFSGSPVSATGNTLSGINSGTFGIVRTGPLTSANNGQADQLYGYIPNGVIAAGASAIGFTAPCSGLELCVNGNGEFDGTSLLVHNAASATTGVYVDTNGQAQIQFRDNTKAAKWEFGHTGSGGSYQLRLWNDTTGAMAMTVDAATSNVAFAGPVKPGSVAVGGTNACSTAGQRAWVTDASVAFSASTRGGQITGSSTNAVPAYCDGAHWLYD